MSRIKQVLDHPFFWSGFFFGMGLTNALNAVIRHIIH
jgi:hypothetical protein